MQLMIEYGLLGRLWLVYLANIYSLFSNKHIPDHQLEFPRWFFYSEDVNEPKLLNLMVDVVFTPASSLPGVSLCKDSSKDCIVGNPSCMGSDSSSLHKRDLISVVEYCSFSLVTTL